MGIIKSNKVASKKTINGKEAFTVTLSLEAEPNIRDNPKDIIIVMDRSSSMNGEPLASLKTGVNHFIDVVTKSTAGVDGVTIGGGSRIGIVSFSSTAKIDLPLTNSVVNINKAVNAVKASGSTNHADAYQKAIDALQGSHNDKVIVMFTDGVSNAGSEGYDIAELAKAQGIEIYCMGFSLPGTIDIEAFKKWASAPTDSHILVTPEFGEIEALFDTLAGRISEPPATNIVLTDKVNPCFDITAIGVPTKGSAVTLDKHTVKWNIDKLAEFGTEKVEFKFFVQHNGTCRGVQPVNASYDYKDDELNTIALPAPNVTILTDAVEMYEDCPVPKDIIADSCEDYITYDAGDVVMENIGRVVQISATIKNVCPNKDVALAVVLSEVDGNNNEAQRGMKTLLLPAHSSSTCKDVRVNCIKFVLPEALDTTGGPNSMCNARKFRARLFANYVDSGYYCCKN